MPVSKLSLNELSRRVGLAKSNVLRYFESREAVLLELFDGELRAWAGGLGPELAKAVSTADPGRAPGAESGPPTQDNRPHAIAAALASSLEERPVLCDLVSAQAAVLERNVSTDVVLRHKRATLATLNVVAGDLREALPELTPENATEMLAAALLTTSAAWPHNHPSEALLAAYEADPDIAAARLNFVGIVTRLLTVLITGLLTEVRHNAAT